MTALRALIWDVDGTLAETERDGHRVAFNQAFAEAGLPWHWDEQLYGELLRVTGGKERLRHYWLQVNPADAEHPDLAQQLAQLHAIKTRHYVAAVRNGAIELRTGVARLISEARAAGVQLAIATTTTFENVSELLRSSLGSEALHWFTCVAAGDIVAHKKPAPDIYAWVLGRLGVRARECLAIEDSAAGVSSARALGIPVVVTRSTYTRGEEMGVVCADLDSLGDPHAPASGSAFGRRFRGTLALSQLARWHARWIGESPPKTDLRFARSASG
jgi:beta-phosphoglucomutase-like phosphatase (HAD superfamily)